MKPNPFIEMLGGTIEAWHDGYAEICIPVSPSLLNSRGVLHGGVAASLLDSVCGLAGLFCDQDDVQRVGATLSLTLSYLEKGVADKIIGKGYVQRMGRSVFFARGEVLTGDGSLIATAQGVFSHAMIPAQAA